MTDHVQQTINSYNQIAAEYAAEAETRIQSIERKLFLDFITPSGKILDVGCGSGKDAAFFMDQGFDVIGVDLSSALLAEAKKYHPNLKTKLMDIRKLKFDDNTFDGIWAHASLLHLDRVDVMPTLQEFYRVLKNNGVYYVFVKEGRGEELKIEKKSHGAARFFTYFTQQEIENYFTETGLKIIKSYTYNGQARDPAARDQNWIVVFGQKSSTN